MHRRSSLDGDSWVVECPLLKWKVGCSIQATERIAVALPGQERSPQPPETKLRLRPKPNKKAAWETFFHSRLSNQHDFIIRLCSKSSSCMTTLAAEKVERPYNIEERNVDLHCTYLTEKITEKTIFIDVILDAIFNIVLGFTLYSQHPNEFPCNLSSFFDEGKHWNFSWKCSGSSHFCTPMTYLNVKRKIFLRSTRLM